MKTSNNILLAAFSEFDPYLTTYDIARKYGYLNQEIITVFEDLYPELIPTKRKLEYKIKKKPEIHIHEEYYVNQGQVDAVLNALGIK